MSLNDIEPATRKDLFSMREKQQKPIRPMFLKSALTIARERVISIFETN